MKKLLSLLVLACLGKALHAQYIYTIKADSVKITNSCDTAELIIEKQIAELRKQLETATGTDKKRIKKKIENIRKTAEGKRDGEEHGRTSKR